MCCMPTIEEQRSVATKDGSDSESRPARRSPHASPRKAVTSAERREDGRDAGDAFTNEAGLEKFLQLQKVSVKFVPLDPGIQTRRHGDGGDRLLGTSGNRNQTRSRVTCVHTHGVDSPGAKDEA